MAISRPFLLALLGAALLGATFVVVQNARERTSEPAAPAVEQAAEQGAQPEQAPQPSEPVKLSAEEAVGAIVDAGTEVESGRLTLRFEARELGGRREREYAEVGGLFAANGGDAIPDFALRATGRERNDAGRIENDDFGLVATAGDAYLTEDGQAYRLPDDASENLGKLRQAIAAGPGQVVSEFALGRWLVGANVVGVAEVNGVEATHLSAKIAPRKVARNVVALVRREAAGAGAQAELPRNLVKRVDQAVHRASLDAWVGSDRVVRRIRVEAVADLPPEALDPGETSRWNFSLSFDLDDVNRGEDIAAPSKVSRLAPAKGMGADDAKEARSMFALAAVAVDAPASMAATTAAFLRLNRAVDEAKVAKQVARAVRKDRKVVVLFQNARGLDDRENVEAMRSLRRTTEAAVFIDDVDHIRAYGKLVEDLGVSQAPSIVIIDRAGDARLIEGYVDAASLTQAVADAR